jgi:peptidoglycan/LPS O-acetylase OafA/YrhL
MSGSPDSSLRAGERPTVPPASGRSVVLDAMRAVAVLLVLGRHVFRIEPALPPWLAAVVTRWRGFGWIGVDLFFVLSGFLVSGLLFAEYKQHGSLHALRFLGRRGFKIYPGFYLLLGGTWLLLGARFPRQNFLYEALFVQNYFGFVWNHTWSLAVEEHFYFGLALVLWAMARFRRGPDPFSIVPLCCLLVFTLVLALRLQAFSVSPRGYLLLPTHFRLDSLLFGTLLAYAWAFRPHFAEWVRRRRRWIVPCSLAALLPCVLLPLENNFTVNTVGLTTNYLGFGGLLIVAVVSGEGRERPWSWPLRALARMGFFSYSIYLWHVPVNHLTAIFLPRFIGWSGTLAAYLAGSVLAGVLMAKLVELPFLRLRDRWLPSRTGRRPAATAGAAPY